MCLARVIEWRIDGPVYIEREAQHSAIVEEAVAPTKDHISQHQLAAPGLLAQAVDEGPDNRRSFAEDLLGLRTQVARRWAELPCAHTVGGQNFASKSERRLEGERWGAPVSVRERRPFAYQSQ